MKAKLDNTSDRICGGCGMILNSPREYHPFAVCQLFRAIHNSDSVRVNIRAVIEFGMDAQRFGVSADDAMADFNTVLDKREE